MSCYVQSFRDMWERLSTTNCPRSWLVTEVFNAIMQTHDRLYEASKIYVEIRDSGS